MVGVRPELGRPMGLPVSSPDGVSQSGPRSEQLVVIATTGQQNLRILEQEGVIRAPGLSPLQELLAQISDGGPRSVRADGNAGPYAIRHLGYLLVPAARAAGPEGDFRIDDRPDVSSVLLALRPPGADPVACTARLAELAVRPEHPRWGPSLRLDVLVVTGAPQPGGPLAYSAITVAFPAARRVRADAHRSAAPRRPDAQPPRHRGLGCQHDPGGAPALQELLSAVAPPVPPADAAPMSAAVAALDAVSTVVATAGQQLAAAVDTPFGLYRATFVAGDGFSPGDHPAVGQPDTLGVALRLRIERG